MIRYYRGIYIKVKREPFCGEIKRGLYSSGKNVVGVDFPFDDPQTPDAIVGNNGGRSLEEIVFGLEKQFGLVRVRERWGNKISCVNYHPGQAAG